MVWLSHWPFTMGGSPCGICGVQNCTGTDFSPSSWFSPVNIIPPWLSIPIYHQGEEQQTCWWPQFRDIDLPNQHEHEQLFIFVRFQVLTAASMMFRIVFWDVLLCKMIVDPDDGGSMHF
jgi:hypothetical protein